MSTAALSSLNWADFCIIGIILLSTAMSFARGFVKESISLLTWITAIWVGLKFSPMLAELMKNAVETPSVRLIASFLALFIAVLVIGGLLNFIISHIVHKTGLSGTNRLIGMVFGLARGILIVGLVILLANHTAFPKDPWWQHSALIPKFEPVANTISKFLPDKLHQVSQLLL